MFGSLVIRLVFRVVLCSRSAWVVCGCHIHCVVVDAVAICLMSSVWFWSPAMHRCVRLWNLLLSVVRLLLLPIVTVLVLYSWMALKAIKSGFPRRKAHPPPLLKTRNDPVISMSLIHIVPVHSASAFIVVPSAICNVCVDGCQPLRQCFIVQNTVVHIALDIAPSSNSACMRCESKCGFGSEQ